MKYLSDLRGQAKRILRDRGAVTSTTLAARLFGVRRPNWEQEIAARKLLDRLAKRGDAIQREHVFIWGKDA